MFRPSSSPTTAITLGGLLAKVRTYGRLERTAEAQTYWHDLYGRLADDDPGGLVGAVIGRDASQVLRLSLLYALLDRTCGWHRAHQGGCRRLGNPAVLA